MDKTIEWIEKTFSKMPPGPDVSVKGKPVEPLKEGEHVVVVGGGIAGSAFVRRLLFLAHKENRTIKVTLVNSTSCNYCGGLITNLALNTFNNVYNLEVPDGVVLTRIKECAYINSAGSFNIRINIPMIGMLRTSKFGVLGFDDSFKERITEGLPEKVKKYLEVIEPTIVTHVLPQEKSKKPWKVILSRKRIEDNKPEELEADFVVMAGGLKMINKPLMKEFQAFTGYIPPPQMPASVTEIDTSEAKVNIMEDKLYIIDGIIPGAVLGLVSKGKNWLSLTSLGKRLEKEDLEQLFAHPEVKKHLDLPKVSEHLRCGVICKAGVYTGPAQNFYGDNWAAIGDLNGYGRVLKDGYLASLVSGKLVAETIIYIGKDKKSLHNNYFRPIKKLRVDNNIGMFLYRINEKLSRSTLFSKFLIKSAEVEKRKSSYGGPIHSAVRSLMTGELPYGWVTILFIVGLFRRLLTPWEFFRK